MRTLSKLYNRPLCCLCHVCSYSANIVHSVCSGKSWYFHSKYTFNKINCSSQQWSEVDSILKFVSNYFYTLFCTQKLGFFFSSLNSHQLFLLIYLELKKIYFYVLKGWNQFFLNVSKKSYESSDNGYIVECNISWRMLSILFLKSISLKVYKKSYYSYNIGCIV